MERVNGTLVPLMQVTAETEVTWDKQIAEMECQLNNASNKTIGDTPFHALYGYYLSFTDGVLSHAVKETKYEDVSKLQQQIRQRILEEHQLWTERHAVNHGKLIQYEVGEVVFLKRATTSTSESTKQQRSCNSIYSICFFFVVILSLLLCYVLYSEEGQVRTLASECSSVN